MSALTAERTSRGRGHQRSPGAVSAGIKRNITAELYFPVLLPVLFLIILDPNLHPERHYDRVRAFEMAADSGQLASAAL
jgi:hypothetical protein